MAGLRQNGRVGKIKVEELGRLEAAWDSETRGVAR